VENCQVGVFAAYASSKGYALGVIKSVWNIDIREDMI